MSPQRRILAGSGIAVILLTSGVKTAPTSTSVTTPLSQRPLRHDGDATRLEPSRGDAGGRDARALPLRFEANRGQFDAETTLRRARPRLRPRADADRRRAVAARRGRRRRVDRHAMSLVGAHAGVERSARSIRCRARSITFTATTRPRGAPTCSVFARVRYAEVYDGIDRRLLRQRSAAARIRLRGRARTRSEDDPSALRGHHAPRRSTTPTGDLLLHVKRLASPCASTRRSRISRSTASAVPSTAATSFTPMARVGFAVGAYDRTRAAHDRSGPALLDRVRRHQRRDDQRHRARSRAATSTSPASRRDNAGLPDHAGRDQTREPGTSDAFVSKFNPSGSALIYSTYPRRRPRTRTTCAPWRQPAASRSTPPATPTSPARRTPTNFPDHRGRHWIRRTPAATCASVRRASM